jgi:hypothetical protein
MSHVIMDELSRWASLAIYDVVLAISKFVWLFVWLSALNTKCIISFVRSPKLETQRRLRWFRSRRNCRVSIVGLVLHPGSASLLVVDMRKSKRSSRSPKSSYIMFQVRDNWCSRCRLSTELTWRLRGGSIPPVFSCWSIVSFSQTLRSNV